jgi:hypothetical protein
MKIGPFFINLHFRPRLASIALPKKTVYNLHELRYFHEC